jgi:hypothetical protein
MEDLALQIAELHRKTQETRNQFLNAEVETCYSILDFGRTELKLGARDVAIAEAREATKTIATITRFLPELEDEGQRSVIEVQLRTLEHSLKSFQREIEK